jgi:tetratricopeptide (TPR) repeat protein
MKIKTSIIAAFLCWTLAGCIKEITPSDAITTSALVQTKEGLTHAVNGAYSLFKDHIEFNGTTDLNLMYLRQYFQMSDFASDDVVCGQVTTDPFFYSFSLNHTPTQTNARYFWYISYKIINDANTVIEAAEKIENPDASVQQLIGECYFIRAFCHFNLARFYAKPYSVDANAPGVILRLSTAEDGQKARSTVKEVYDAIVADAEKAATLMNQPRGVQYASKEAAWALLSRTFLYEENHDSTIFYSNKVINSGRFHLETADGFKTLFANAQTSPETIFCIAFSNVDDYGKAGSIASMLYSDGNSGWGEEFASQSLRDSMSSQPDDVRWSYIVPLMDGGTVKKLNGIEIYYITKFSNQGGSPTLSSPIMFRLAEMYLNRAEAYAKKNQVTEALNDLDEIRKNRGLSDDLYNQQVPAGRNLLDLVLKERRIELAFEGQRTADVYRNKRSLNRTYWGYHLPGLKETDIDLSKQPTGYANMIIPYTHNRIIYYLPIDEVQANLLATQND